MKKTVIALFATFAFAATALPQHMHIHYTDEGYCRQNYASVLTQGGSIIIDENIFDEFGNDIGIKFLKYSGDGVLIDSVFVDDIQMHSCNLFVRNPLSENESVYVTVANNEDDGANYFEALYMSDGMEITDRVRAQLPMEGEMRSMRYHMEEDGNILMNWYNASSDTCRYARLTITGEVLSLSEPMALDTLLPINVPWFKISDEPYRLGFMMFCYNPPDYNNINGNIYINIIDEGLNVLETKKIERIGHIKCRANWTASVVEMGDGCFVIMSEVMQNLGGPEGYYRRGVAKYNANFEPLSFHMIKYVAPWRLPQPMSVDKIDGGVYVVWNEMYENVPFQTHVRYLNSNLDEVWDKVCIKNTNSINVVETSHPLENGGAMLTGYLGRGNYYDSYVYLNIIDPDYDNTEEVTCDGTPFLCYPNPSNGVINLSFAESVECNSAEIFSADGRLVKSQTSNLESIDISGLNAGIYLLKLRLSDGTELTERIVKE